MIIDAVIDVVCPWCYVGKRQLDRAVAMRGQSDVMVHYRPYQLAPDMPASGMERRAYYKAKFGDSPKAKEAQHYLREVGSSLGIDFDFTSPVTVANTLDAHRLLRWAWGAGVQDRAVEGLMRRYFEEARSLGDIELLVEVAEEAGMDGDLVRTLLQEDTDKDHVSADVKAAYQMGISGVPTFIFDGEAAISGAQDASTLVEVMNKAAVGELGQAAP